MAFEINGGAWINGRSVSQQNRVQTVAASTGSIAQDIDEVRVTYTSTAAVTDLEYSDALVASRKESIVVYDAGGTAGSNNITIKTTADAVVCVLNEDGQSVELACDGTSVDIVSVY